MSLQASVAGATAGGFGGALIVVTIGVLAPRFLDPALPAAIAILMLAMLVGALAGALAGLARAATAGARIAGAVVGVALGALLVRWCMPAASAWQLALGASSVGLVLGWLGGPIATRPWPTLAAAVVLVAAGLGIASRPVAQADDGAGVVIVGLDGGTWRVIDPLLAAGELPTMAHLMREGTSGTLWSMEPSSSAILWTTIATGRRPEEHGIHDFYGTQNDDLRAARFWEVASAAGERVGIFQWLVTWPPDALPGFVVPGWLARDAVTHPPSLQFVKTLEVRLQRRQRPPLGEALAIGSDAVAQGLRFASVAEIAADGATALRLGDQRGWYRAGKLAQLSIHGDVFLEQLRRDQPPVSAVVFYGSDALSHAYWKYHEPAAYADVSADDVRDYGESIRDYYRRFDAFMARLLETVGPRTTIVVVSDHGFHAEPDHQLTVQTPALLDLAGAKDFTAHAINRQVYLTHAHPGTPEATADVERVAATLRGLLVADTRLLDVEVAAGERVGVELRTDAMHASADAVITGGTVPRAMRELLTRTTWSGSHENEGILLVRGPGIHRGHKADAHILDIAPTVLAMRGHPIAADMDGRVLTELWMTPPVTTTVASHDAAMPPRVAAAASDTADDTLDARLRALGYVR